MKALSLVSAVLLLVSTFLRAEPREWTEQATGRKISAEFLALEGDQVKLRMNGRELLVPVARLSEADQAYLKIIGGSAPMPGPEAAPEETGKKPAASAAKVIGPVETEGSTYFYYIPASLKPGKRAPLIFYTGSGGGSAGTVKRMVEGAEICGWIAACSVESKNAVDNAQCVVHSERCVKHLIATQPVDPERLYFAGNSGGARVAYKNSKKLEGAGVLAIIAGAQKDEMVKSKHYFMISGSTDYNRYDTSGSFAELRKTAALRFHPGAHADGPDWMVTEGIVWLETAWRQKQGTPPAEGDAFEAASSAWVKGMKSSAAHRAAWWSDFFQTRFAGPEKAQMATMAKELGGSPENVAYMKGLVALEDYADSVLAPEGPYYKPGHTSAEIQRKADKILNEYGASPWIKEIATAMKNPVVGTKK